MERRTVCQLNAISTSAELAGKGTQSNPYLIRSKENWAEAAAKAEEEARESSEEPMDGEEAAEADDLQADEV